MNKYNFYISCFLLTLFLVPNAWAEQTKISGTASWFGEYHHGKKTASGELFDMYALTAAHKKYEFGTIIKVTNEQNGKSVLVKINDRGPYSKKRVLDLSYGAATKINMVNSGVTKVKMEKVGEPDGTPIDPNLAFFVKLEQVTSLASQNESLNKLIRLGQSNVQLIELEGKKLLALGPYKNFEEAQDKLLQSSSTHPKAEIILANNDFNELAK